jgi:prolyl oligopeptidase
MNKKILFFLPIFLMFLFPELGLGQKYEPIPAAPGSVIDRYFNRWLVEDPYQWLEEVSDTATVNWVARQNKMCDRFLRRIRNRLTTTDEVQIYSQVNYDLPKKEGIYYFRMAYSDRYGVPVLWFKKSVKGNWRELIDPEDISDKDNMVIRSYKISSDSRWLACEFSRNGSDWGEIRVIDMKSRDPLSDLVTGVRHSSIAWMGDGFFYSTFTKDGQFGASRQERVLFHKIGTDQQADTLVFERKDNKSVTFRYVTSTDQQYFVLMEYNAEKGSQNIFYADYLAEYKGLKTLLYNVTTFDIDIIDSHQGQFIATVREENSDKNIAMINPSDPMKWQLIGQEFSDAFLQEVIPFKDKILAVYQSSQKPVILTFRFDGEMIDMFSTPMGSSLDGFSGGGNDSELLFSYQSYTYPPIVYQMNVNTFEKELTEPSTVTFDFKTIKYKMVEYYSTDSVLVPMMLVYNDDIKLNGNNPLILNAYGGFKIISPPQFDPGIVWFIKHGGIYAFANIRGGGDKGIAWAKAGRGEHKQTSFDDFIAAAEYLVKKNYTNPAKLAATGTSNGGLVVAAAAIQRPDLFKVVVPVVAPLDMLRFELFTVGKYWQGEYGTVRDSASFRRLLGFSPYHNIRKEVNYPAMLVITGENDDRVPPFHSYKFVARLQNRPAQVNPILLKTYRKTGHQGAAVFNERIEELSDKYGFILSELEMKSK